MLPSTAASCRCWVKTSGVAARRFLVASKPAADDAAVQTLVLAWQSRQKAGPSGSFGSTSDNRWIWGAGRQGNCALKSKVLELSARATSGPIYTLHPPALFHSSSLPFFFILTLTRHREIMNTLWHK